MKLLDVSTVQELRSIELPKSWAALQRNRAKYPLAPIFGFLDSYGGKSLAENAYRALNGTGQCLYCSGEVPFKTWKHGFASYCSRKCATLHTANTAKIKRANTMLSRYGGTSTLSSPVLREKVQKTSLAKYGHINPTVNLASKLKRIETNNNRYGGNSPNANPEIAAKQGHSKQQSSILRHIDAAAASGFTLLEGDVFETTPSTWQCQQGHIFNHRWLTTQREPICRICTPYMKGTSHPEQELARWVESNIPIIRNHRLYISTKSYFEFDIFIPTKNLAIEYNGLYWHSELAGKDANYHLQKLQAAENAGIQLIQLFAHEWEHKKDICKSVILSKLGLNQIRHQARKLSLINVERKIAQQFFEQTHLAGVAKFEFALGLTDGKDLIAVGAWGSDRFGKDKNILELIRFSTKSLCSVAGGLSKITSAAMRLFPDRTLKSFCDRRWGTGLSYLKSGWVLAGETKPGYWYFNSNSEVFHRTRFQRQKLVELVQNTEGTEWDLAQQYGLNRFWDCGNLTFIKKPNNV